MTRMGESGHGVGMSVRACVSKIYIAAKTGVGTLGVIGLFLGGLFFIWRLAGDVEFLVNNWAWIEPALKDWGPLIGLLLGSLFISKALYDTSSPAPAAPPTTQNRVTVPTIFDMEGPNYAAWDHAEVVTLEQAAHLWAEEDPLVPFVSADFIAYRQMLTSKFDRDIKGVMMPAMDGTNLSKEWLLEIAKETNERPKFLFPDERF